MPELEDSASCAPSGIGAGRDMQLAPLKRLSFCPCGFSVLHDHIRVGTMYRIDINSLRGGALYICGGCSRVHNNVFVIDATTAMNHSAPLRPLPYALFSGSTSTRISAGDPKEGQKA